MPQLVGFPLQGDRSVFVEADVERPSDGVVRRAGANFGLVSRRQAKDG